MAPLFPCLSTHARITSNSWCTARCNLLNYSVKVDEIISKMPKKCIICKVEPSPISNRSFHMFPKSESVRKKWVDVVNVSKPLNFKTSFICSDHFDEESYFPYDEYKQRMRLRPEAVPAEKKQITLFLLPAKNVTEESAIISINNGKVNDEIKDEETEMSTDEVSFTHVSEDISSQSHLDEEMESRTDEMPLRDPLKLEESNKSPDGCKTETVDSFELKNNSTSNDESNSKKRKNSFTDVRARKNVRFMTGFRTEYIRREDFVDDEAWYRFLRFLSYQKSKTAAAYSRNSRKNRKIQSLKGVIDGLGRKRRK